MTETDFKYRLYKLELKPGDVVVVEITTPFGPEVVKSIQRWIWESIGDVRVVVTHDGCKLVSAEDLPV